MRAESNPYQAPQAPEFLNLPPAVQERGLNRFALIGWPIALGANLPIPLMFGVQVTEYAGRWGMSLAILVFLGTGYLLCYCMPNWSRRIVIVSLLFALTQFVPIIQILAGAFAIDIADQLPYISRFSSNQLSNELAGFVVTFIVGVLLNSIVAGLILLLSVATRGINYSKSRV